MNVKKTTFSIQIYLCLDAVMLHIVLLALATDVSFVALPVKKPQQQTLGLENQNTSDKMTVLIPMTTTAKILLLSANVTFVSVRSQE